MSIGDDDELAGVDNKFGFFSAGRACHRTACPTSKYGAWNVHGGVEFQKLGDTTAFFNGDDDSQVVGSIGIGFSDNPAATCVDRERPTFRPASRRT